METKREVLTYSLAVRGVFGRNRKSKFEMFTLAKHQAEPLPLEQLMAMMRAKLVEMKVKPGAKVSVREQPMTLEVREMGERTYTVESFMCFSDKTMYEEETA